MTTPASKALEDSIILNNGAPMSGSLAFEYLKEHWPTIRRALLVLDEIESGRSERADDPQRDGYDVGHTHGWNDCLIRIISRATLDGYKISVTARDGSDK